MTVRQWGVSVVLVALGALACTDDGSLVAPRKTSTALPRTAPGGATYSVAPPLVVQTTSTDWASQPVGSAPTGWTQIWDPTPYFLVVAEPTVPSGKVLQWSATGQTRNRWGLQYDGFGDTKDQEVYTEVRARVATVPDVSYMGSAAVRMSGTAFDEHGYAVFFVDNPSWNQRNVVLSTWLNGFYWELGSYALTWQDDVWYSVRLRAIGEQLSAKIWPRGTTEPTTWQIDAWDQKYSTGRPGLANHDNGTVQWATWTGTVLADTSTVRPPSGASYQTTFSEFATGSAPTGWTATSAPNGVTWSVAADATVSDSRVLRSATTVTNRHILRYNGVADTTTVEEVLVKMRLADNDDRGPGVAVRHTMDASGHESAYVAYLRSNADLLEVNAFVAGGWQYVGSVSFVNNPGVWYWMRFRADGSSLRVNVWADGTPEPTSWTLLASHSALTAGSVGLYSYEPNNVDYDAFSVATGGLSAPAPTASSPPPPPPPPPTLTQLTVTPAAPSVQVGGTQQFQVSGTMSDGSTSSPTVNWTATGGTISSSGLFTAGATAGTYQVTATAQGTSVSGSTTVTVTAAPPPPPPPPPPPGGTFWQTGFASTAGALPVGWTVTSAPNNVTWAAAADATATDGSVLRSTVSSTGRHIVRWDSVPDSTTTQEGLVRIRLANDDDRGPGIALRHTLGFGGAETAYVAYLRSSSDQVEINAFVNGGWQFVGAASFVNNPGQWYWMRFRAEGSTLRVRVWADGDAEPSSWTLTGTNSAITAGSAGLYSYEPNTVDFDQFSVATSGGTAP